MQIQLPLSQSLRMFPLDWRALLSVRDSCLAPMRYGGGGGGLPPQF